MQQPRLSGLWRHSDFRKLWTAHTIAQFGTRITFLAMPLTAILVTEDASAAPRNRLESACSTHRKKKMAAMIQSLCCIRCGTTYPVTKMPAGCPECLNRGKPASVAPQQVLAGESSMVVIVLTATGVTSPQDLVADLPTLVPLEPTADALLRAIRY